MYENEDNEFGKHIDEQVVEDSLPSSENVKLQQN